MIVHLLSLLILYVLYSTLGWTDVTLFAIFENKHINANQVSFLKKFKKPHRPYSNYT